MSGGGGEHSLSRAAAHDPAAMAAAAAAAAVAARAQQQAAAAQATRARLAAGVYGAALPVAAHPTAAQAHSAAAMYHALGGAYGAPPPPRAAGGPGAPRELHFGEGRAGRAHGGQAYGEAVSDSSPNAAGDMWEQGPPPGLYSGTCKWFNIKEGFGFILPDHQHEPELFFHGFHLSSSRVKHKIWPGVELTYDKSVDKKGRPMAINVGYAGSADSWQEARNACRSQRVFDIIKDGAGLAHSDEYATSRYQQQQYTSSMHHVQHQHASLQQHPTAVLGGGSRSASWNRAMGVSLEDAHYMQQLQVAQVQQQQLQVAQVQQQQVQVAAAVAQQAAVQQVAAVAAQQPALVAQQPVLVAQQAAQQAAAVAQVAQVQQAQQAAAVAQAAVQQGAAVAAAQVAQVAAQQQIAMAASPTAVQQQQQMFAATAAAAAAASPTAVQQQQQMFAQQAQQRHLYHQQQQQLAAQHHFLYACQQAEQQQQQQEEEHADNAAEGGEEADGDSPPTPPPRQQQPALVAADDGVPTPPAPATQAQPLCAPRQRPTSFPSSPSPPSEGLRTAADGHGEGASSQDTAAVVPSSTSSQDTGASMLSPTSVCSAGDASGDRDFGADGDVALKDLQQLRLPPRRAFGANKVESEPVPTLTLPFGGAESSAGGVAGVGSNGEHSAPPQATAIRRSHSAWGAHSGRHGHGGGRPYPTHPTTALTAPDARARALARIEQQGAAQQQRMHSHGAMAHAPPRIPHRRTASSGAKVDVSRSHGSGHPAAVGPPLTGCADPGFAVKRATSGPLFGAGKVGWFQRSASLFSDSGRSPGDAEPPEQLSRPISRFAAARVASDESGTHSPGVQLSRPISRFAAARVASDESSTHSPGVQRAQPTLFGSVPNSMDYM